MNPRSWHEPDAEILTAHGPTCGPCERLAAELKQRPLSDELAWDDPGRGRHRAWWCDSPQGSLLDLAPTEPDPEPVYALARTDDPARAAQAAVGVADKAPEGVRKAVGYLVDNADRWVFAQELTALDVAGTEALRRLRWAAANLPGFVYDAERLPGSASYVYRVARHDGHVYPRPDLPVERPRPCPTCRGRGVLFLRPHDA